MNTTTSSVTNAAFGSPPVVTNQPHLRAHIVDVLYRSAPRHVRSLEITGSETLSRLGFSSLRLIGLIVALENDCGLAAEALLGLSGDTTIEELMAVCLTGHDRPLAPMHAKQVRVA